MNLTKKILVIEDDDIARELMRMTLERHGYHVETAENGSIGFDVALSFHPDLIIADILMPVADGIELVHRVRGSQELAATPIMVTTAFGTGNASFSLSKGADAYEPKPVNPASLIENVRRLLDQ